MKTKSDIRYELLHSAELMAMFQQFILGALLLILMYPFIVISNGLRSGSYLWGAAGVILAICLLPYLIFCLWRSFRIFRKCEHYRFQKAKLSQPHSGWPRGMMYFTVILENPADGGKFLADTRPIFNSHSCFGLGLEDYINKTITIAYNEETENVVVIG